MAGAPYPKSLQMARAERRYVRKVASPKMWARIAAEKQGPCRACGAAPPNELAHLVARAQGGPDAEFNIVPLCGACHVLFDARHSIALGGEAVFERRVRYPLRGGSAVSDSLICYRIRVRWEMLKLSVSEFLIRWKGGANG